jgi:hypothetical protein
MLIKKFVKVIALSLSIGTLLVNVCFADIPQEDNNKIPAKMNPGTVILYDSNNRMKIIDAGNTVDIHDARETTKVDKEKLPQNTVVTDYNNEPINLPIHTAGMTVSYDGIGNPAIIKGGTDENSTSTLPDNSATLSGTKAEFGNISYFNDVSGDNGHILTNFDCATKIGLDNPPSGTTIYAFDSDHEISVTLYKWDTGTLPKAILDVRPYVFTKVFGWPLSQGLIDGYYYHN